MRRAARPSSVDSLTVTVPLERAGSDTSGSRRFQALVAISGTLSLNAKLAPGYASRGYKPYQLELAFTGFSSQAG
jgi:hypothetical protein